MALNSLSYFYCYHYLSNVSLLSSPHFPKREKSGLLNNLQKLVQSIIKVNSSNTPPTYIITA